MDGWVEEARRIRKKMLIKGYEVPVRLEDEVLVIYFTAW
jgi:hypothetical protein